MLGHPCKRGSNHLTLHNSLVLPISSIHIGTLGTFKSCMYSCRAAISTWHHSGDQLIKQLPFGCVLIPYGLAERISPGPIIFNHGFKSAKSKHPSKSKSFKINLLASYCIYWFQRIQKAIVRLVLRFLSPQKPPSKKTFRCNMKHRLPDPGGLLHIILRL